MARLFDDGASDYLEVASAVISGEPCVMASWFNSNDTTVDGCILQVQDSAQGGEYLSLWAAGAWAGGDENILAISRAALAIATTSTTWTVDTWHHACGIWITASSRAAFLDGGGKGTDVNASVDTGFDTTSVGRQGDSSPSRYMSGRLAETAIWDLTNWTGATAADKAALFEATALPALAAGYSPLFFPLGLRAYWPLTRGLNDRVGGFTLTANGTTVVAQPRVLYPGMKHLAHYSVAAPEVRVPRYGFTNFQIPGIV